MAGKGTPSRVGSADTDVSEDGNSLGMSRGDEGGVEVDETDGSSGSPS